MGFFGQHRKAGSAAGLIGLGEARRIEVGADQAFRGRCLLDLGDQGEVALAYLCLQRPNEPARRRRVSSTPFKFWKWRRRFAVGDVCAFDGADPGENVGHRDQP